MDIKKYLPILSLFALLICAYFSRGYHHFDEHFQIIEFANWKQGGAEAGDMPWEFRKKMRPTLQPTLAYGLMRLADGVGLSSPFLIAFFLRIVSALLAWSVFRRTRILFPLEHRRQFTVAYFSLLLWFMLYNGVRFSSENWSGAFFLLGLTFSLTPSVKGVTKYILVGLLFGIAFQFRYQMAFAMVGFGLHLLFIRRVGTPSFLALLVGFAPTLGLGCLLDSWFYEEPVFAAWNYLEQNIIEDKVSGFGIEPWYYYISKVFMRPTPIFGLAMLAGLLALMIRRPKDIVLWSIIPFLLVHNTIGHKEIRFLFPLLYFGPYLIYQALEFISHEKWRSRTRTVLIWMNVPLLCFVMFSPADKYQGLYRHVYFSEQQRVWTPPDNPLYRVTLPLNFYTDTSKDYISYDNLPVGAWKDGDMLVSREAITHPSLVLSYTNFPSWVLEHFNFNDWASRTGRFYVYEVDS